MGLPTLNKFCCCCELETGGVIIGWINTIFSFLGFLGSIGIVFLGSTALLVARNSDQRTAGIVAIIVGSLYIVFFLIYFVAGISLINAVKHRDHNRMRLILILMGIGVILSFISIATSTLGGLAGAIIYSVFTCYFFLCIYSLYVKLKHETRGGTVHMQPMNYNV